MPVHILLVVLGIILTACNTDNIMLTRILETLKSVMISGGVYIGILYITEITVVG